MTAEMMQIVCRAESVLALVAARCHNTLTKETMKQVLDSTLELQQLKQTYQEGENGKT